MFFAHAITCNSAYLDLMLDLMHEYRSELFKGPFQKLAVMFLWLIGNSVGLISQRSLVRISDKMFLFFCSFSGNK